MIDWEKIFADFKGEGLSLKRLSIELDIAIKTLHDCSKGRDIGTSKGVKIINLWCQMHGIAPLQYPDPDQDLNKLISKKITETCEMSHHKELQRGYVASAISDTRTSSQRIETQNHGQSQSPKPPVIVRRSRAGGKRRSVGIPGGSGCAHPGFAD